MGLSVPDVITTLWNFSNTGFIAREESKQLSCSHKQKKSGLKFKLHPQTQVKKRVFTKIFYSVKKHALKLYNEQE